MYEEWAPIESSLLFVDQYPSEMFVSLLLSLDLCKHYEIRALLVINMPLLQPHIEAQGRGLCYNTVCASVCV